MYQEERKSTETLQLVASERRQAISIRSRTQATSASAYVEQQEDGKVIKSLFLSAKTLLLRKEFQR